MIDDLNQLPLNQLFHRLVNPADLRWLIEAAKHEDLHDSGDMTSQLFIGQEAEASAEFRSRKPGKLAGAVLLQKIAHAYDEHLHVLDVMPDGSTVAAGDVIGIVSGSTRSLLSAERVMLNFLTHLSGIATLTARYVEAVAGTRAKIYDTRKTIPGLRNLAKYAVRCGGGYMHRIGLYDAVLVKDNHLASPGDLKQLLSSGIERARRLPTPPSFIEVEVDTLEQLRVVIECDVDVILLDNMTPPEMVEAVRLRDQAKPTVQLEASGGVNLDTVRAIAQTGVDRIAIGALTHSAPSLDVGLDIV
jgi:nicotinate-nucleotide pyrophosphorylase (carboxylating)